jgi:hypothetical protein
LVSGHPDPPGSTAFHNFLMGSAFNKSALPPFTRLVARLVELLDNPSPTATVPPGPHVPDPPADQWPPPHTFCQRATPALQGTLQCFRY